jgi:deoxyribodipyrimidine photo-lyase
MNVLVWLKRDLRVHDHPALTLAAGLGPVLPVYVVEPELWSQPDASARQWEFVAESLADLREDLARLGAPLVVRVGDAVQVLEAFVASTGSDGSSAMRRPGTSGPMPATGGWPPGHDLRGIPWTEVPQCGVVRRLPTRDGWASSAGWVHGAASVARPRRSGRSRGWNRA